VLEVVIGGAAGADAVEGAVDGNGGAVDGDVPNSVEIAKATAAG